MGRKNFQFFKHLCTFLLKFLAKVLVQDIKRSIIVFKLTTQLPRAAVETRSDTHQQ